MIIDKLTPYYKEASLGYDFEELQKRISEVESEIYDHINKRKPVPARLKDEMKSLIDRRETIHFTASNLYASNILNSELTPKEKIKAVTDDMAEVLDAVTMADYRTALEAGHIGRLENGEPTTPIIGNAENTAEGYESYVNFLFSLVRPFETAHVQILVYVKLKKSLRDYMVNVKSDDELTLKGDEVYTADGTPLFNVNELDNYLNVYADMLATVRTDYLMQLDRFAREAGYEPVEEGSHLSIKGRFVPTVLNKSITAFNKISPRDEGTIDRVSETAVIEEDGATFSVKLEDALPPSIGVGVRKLLMYSNILYCRENHTGTPKTGKVQDISIDFPLEDYAIACGKKTTKDALKDVRKSLKSDLTTLYNVSVSWSQKTKYRNGKEDVTDFMDTRIITAKGIKNGVVHIEFSPRYAEALSKHSVSSKYPTALFKINAYNGNAWIMANIINSHYHNEAKARRGSNKRLQVKTLLKSLDLPTFKQVRETRKSWKDRIKEPFEKCLDELMRVGFLADHLYTGAKGAEINQEFDTFEAWEKSYLEFTLVGEDEALRIAYQEEMQDTWGRG